MFRFTNLRTSLSIAGALVALGVLSGPGVALAAPPESEMIAADMFLGTIETNAVTGPIQVGGVLYIPTSATGGGHAVAPLFLGTIQTNAVTGPIQVGGVLYIP